TIAPDKTRVAQAVSGAAVSNDRVQIVDSVRSAVEAALGRSKQRPVAVDVREAQFIARSQDFHSRSQRTTLVHASGSRFSGKRWVRNRDQSSRSTPPEQIVARIR